MCGLDAERIHKAAKRIRLLFDGVAKGKRPVRIAMAEQIRRDHAVMLAQPVEHAPPGIKRLANGMHKDQRLAGACFDVMHTRALMPHFGPFFKRRLSRIGCGHVFWGCGIFCASGFRSIGCVLGAGHIFAAGCTFCPHAFRSAGRGLRLLGARAAHLQLAGEFDFDIFARVLGIDELFDF